MKGVNCADEFRLASLYSDGMVLKSISAKSNSYPYIWGYAEPDTVVEITLVSPDGEDIASWTTFSNAESYWGRYLSLDDDIIGNGFTLEFTTLSNGKHVFLFTFTM